MRKPIKAYGGNGRSAIYEFDDGTAEMRNGGTIAWRSTNPGNVESGEFAKSHGGIGNNGRFAVFPDYATGYGAMCELFDSGWFPLSALFIESSRRSIESANSIQSAPAGNFHHGFIIAGKLKTT